MGRSLFVVLLVPLGAGFAQSQTQQPAEKPKSALERQRAAAARQSGTSVPAGFFTTAWSAPLTPLPLVPTRFSGADCEPLPEAELTKLVFSAATAEGIDPALVRAVINHESGGKPCAVSPKGAQGLMQLMPGTQGDLAVTDAFDPSQNVAGGAKYLKHLLTRFKGDLAQALAAYNAGPEAVDNAKGIPDFPETKNYVASILAAVNATAGENAQ
jgi:soluble lytic murein transglycosylase-like protein